MTDLNQVTYGNPSIEEKQDIETPTILDALYPMLKEHPFAVNDSQLVRDELNQIAEFTRSMQDEQNADYLKRYRAYDRSILQSVTSTFKTKGVDAEAICSQIASDLSGLITKLKYFYQRPRPAQLAQYLQLNLFPFRSHSAPSPSYPSRHVVEAVVMLNVLGNKYPIFYKDCKDMIADICYSRTYLGLNFEGDIDFSKKVADAILKFPEFSKKYQI